MKIRCLVVGQLQTNCYLVFDESSSQGIIIDPGDDADYISRIISDEKIKPTKIIATHGHFDHIMATAELQLAFDIPFLIHKNDEFLVKRMNETSLYFTGVKGGLIPKINDFLKQEQEIKVGNLIFKIIETPGHSPGGISLYSQKENTAFVGDLVFVNGGVGRTDFSYSNPLDLESSIKNIFSLPNKTSIFPGHGLETSISEEHKFHNT